MVARRFRTGQRLWCPQMTGGRASQTGRMAHAGPGCRILHNADGLIPVRERSAWAFSGLRIRSLRMQDTTTTIRRVIGRGIGAMALSSALALLAGCHSNSAAAASGPDPAYANLAPVNGQTQVMGQNTAYEPQQQGEYYPQQQPQQPQGYYPQQQAPAPVEQGYGQQGYNEQGAYPNDQEYAGEEALADTTEAPPPLPEYDQPEAPGPNYIWTPGYWAWGPGGYYWVPGAWVEAPYYGALWTPPYWGWYGGRYRFHPGYWGRHIGYYGGIDYGFGYIGIGYFGGYWNGNNFYYNRSVTRVGPGVRTIYERPVIYNNVRYSGRPMNRVSYNGGRGGINVQPRPEEMAAMRERHDPPMAVQHQARIEASQNRAQFFAENRGRPAQPALARGFANTRGIAPAPRGGEPGVGGQPNGAGRFEGRPGQPMTQPGAPGNRFENRPGQPGGQPQPNATPNRFENRPGQPGGQPQPNGAPNRFENRPGQPGGQPQPNGAPNRFENRPGQPGGQPQPNGAPNRFENRPGQPNGQPQPNGAPNRFENRGAQPQPQPNAAPNRFENRGGQPQPNAAPNRFENRP